MVVITSAAACNSARASLDGFPGLSIEATCRTASMTAQYSEVAPAYPGERVSGDLLQPAYLLGTGELPLPCIDHRAEVYRIRQHTGGEFFGTTLVVGISRSTAGARIWAVEQRMNQFGTKTRRGGRTLLEAEWRGLARQIAAIHFWTQPAFLPPVPSPNPNERRGTVNVEGYNAARYHGVSRLDDEASVQPVARAFADLARPLIEGAQ